MQKQKEITVDDYPEYAEKQKCVQSLQLKKIAVLKEIDQIVMEMMKPVQSRTAWELASQGDDNYPLRLDSKSAQRQRLTELEGQDRFLDEAIAGGSAELATLIDRNSLEPCREAVPEVIEQIAVILTALKQIDQANIRLAEIRANIERRGFRAGSLPVAMFDLGGSWNDKFGGRVVGYQRYISEAYPDVAELAEQPRQRKAS